jgi:hypothetical protein
MRPISSSRLAAAALIALASRPLHAQQSTQAIDSAYTARIRELTPTDPGGKWKFTTELVDHLPASTTVPTPLAHLGYVPGTVGRLSHTAAIHAYYRKLADAAPQRARFVSLGPTDEGKEMVLLAIADEATMARLDEYRQMLHRLSDPRGLSAAERARLVREAKPIYWVTGSIHSPETGSPEMLMEMAYRLIVSETEHVRAIRRGVITLITPVIEVDGRDRVVDMYNQSRALKIGNRAGGLPYWGKYTAHDNNRDAISMSQKLTQNFLRGFLHWRPVISHDLHESVPFLYTSTGTGPYNDEFDPIVVNEWHQLAFQEVNELTKRGLPGVWTHGFYDGWAPNYMLAITNLHNALGKFYETYTSSGADCHTVTLAASALTTPWYRSNPPVNGVRWCIRSNINYQQSGVLVALRYVADNAHTFLDNYAMKAERMIARGRREAPYAFVIPRSQTRAAEAADFVNLVRLNGTEVHEAAEDFVLTGNALRRITDSSRVSTPGNPIETRFATIQVRKGDWVVRLDQPYTQTVRTLLAIQNYKPDDPAPYDDTGWTQDLIRHIETVKISDSSVLAKPMTMLGTNATVAGTVRGTR